MADFLQRIECDWQILNLFGNGIFADIADLKEAETLWGKAFLKALFQKPIKWGLFSGERERRACGQLPNRLDHVE